MITDSENVCPNMLVKEIGKKIKPIDQPAINKSM